MRMMFIFEEYKKEKINPALEGTYIFDIVKTKSRIKLLSEKYLNSTEK